MNIFQLVADTCHLFAVLLLLFKILKTKSCAGISGKSQLLFLTVALTRYLDLFTIFISYYLMSMKIILIGLTALTVLLIFVVYKSTYESEHDTFNIACLVILAAALAFYINHEFYFLEILWTFSIYLEAVAIVPQFYLVRKTGQMDMFLFHYLFAMGLYRGFYIFNWVYRYQNEGFFDKIAFWSGCMQTALYCYFLFTQDFLKRLACAHHGHQLVFNEKEYMRLEEDAEHTVVEGLEDQTDGKVLLLVHQTNSTAVPVADQDTSIGGIPVHVQVAGSSAAQTGQAGSSQDGNSGVHNHLSAAAAAAAPAVAAVSEAPLGEEARNSCVEVKQIQPQ